MKNILYQLAISINVIIMFSCNYSGDLSSKSNDNISINEDTITYKNMKNDENIIKSKFQEIINHKIEIDTLLFNFYDSSLKNPHQYANFAALVVKVLNDNDESYTEGIGQKFYEKIISYDSIYFNRIANYSNALMEPYKTQVKNFIIDAICFEEEYLGHSSLNCLNKFKPYIGDSTERVIRNFVIINK